MSIPVNDSVFANLIAYMESMVNDTVISAYNASDQNLDMVSDIFKRVYGTNDYIGNLTESTELQGKLTKIRNLHFALKGDKFATLMEAFTQSVIKTFVPLNDSQGINIDGSENIPVIAKSGKYYYGSHAKIIIEENASNIVIVARDWLELKIGKNAKCIAIECGSLATIQLFKGVNDVRIVCDDKAVIFLFDDVHSCEILTGQNSNVCLYNGSHDNTVSVDLESKIEQKDGSYRNRTNQRIV